MPRIKKDRNEPKPLFRVGDHVSFLFGSGEVTGQIIEDRGCLGIGGRRLYGITFEINPGQSTYTEMPEVELTAADTPAKAPEGKRGKN
jgi:hypothetical protein